MRNMKWKNNFVCNLLEACLMNLNRHYIQYLYYIHRRFVTNFDVLDVMLICFLLFLHYYYEEANHSRINSSKSKTILFKRK